LKQYFPFCSERALAVLPIHLKLETVISDKDDRYSFIARVAFLAGYGGGRMQSSAAAPPELLLRCISLVFSPTVLPKLL
jgi:hypothetical protein